jgi:hypothetical protein
MGLAEHQAALARLYTNAPARREFYADPDLAGRRWGLDAAEIAQLSAIRPQIEAFAGSLIAKRRNEVAKILPATCRSLGDRFAGLFREHAEAFIPAGIHRHDGDALAFARFLCVPGRTPGLPAAMRDIARWEAALVQVRQSGRPLLRLFRYDIRPALMEAGGSEACRRSLTIAVVWRSRTGFCRTLVERLY